jgi:hypothetical protein
MGSSWWYLALDLGHVVLKASAVCVSVHCRRCRPPPPASLPQDATLHKECYPRQRPSLIRLSQILLASYCSDDVARCRIQEKSKSGAGLAARWELLFDMDDGGCQTDKTDAGGEEQHISAVDKRLDA